MVKFKVKTKKRNNSHPLIKIKIREWVKCQFNNISVLDVYGGRGLMYKKVWFDCDKYDISHGDAIIYLNGMDRLEYDVYDIDPYASPFEAIDLVLNKSIKNKIGLCCTDGILRKYCMMRMNIPDFLVERVGFKKRDLSLMASIYYNYPAYIRHIFSKLTLKYRITKLVVNYGIGTWKQGTTYFSVILTKNKIKNRRCDNASNL